MDLIKFKAYHDEVNRFIGKLYNRKSNASIAELVLIYGIRCEKLGYMHTELSTEELTNLMELVDAEDNIIEIATLLYTLVPKALMNLRIREKIRKCRTEEDLYEVMLEGYKSTVHANNNRKDFLIKLDDEISEKLLVITTIAMFMDKELLPFFTPKGKRMLCGNSNVLDNTEEADYLAQGSFMIYPLTTLKSLEKSLSRRKLETLAQINYRFKEEFISDKEHKEYTLLNTKESDLLVEVQNRVMSYATAIASGRSPENIRNKLVKSTEDTILEYLETLQVKEDDLTQSIQKVAFRIVEEFDANNVNLAEYMHKSAERIVNECRPQINAILEIVSGIHGVTLRLSKFCAKLDSSEQRVNSNKRALLRKYQGVSEAKRWIAIITTDLMDTLRYYCDYINAETVELYKETNTIDSNVQKEIKKADKDIKKKLKNIYCYKELNRIAIDKGYSKVRQKGDHGIFRKSDGSVVVIPQGRDIGKGLSRRIQKDCNRG